MVGSSVDNEGGVRDSCPRPGPHTALEPTRQSTAPPARASLSTSLPAALGAAALMADRRASCRLLVDLLALYRDDALREDLERAAALLLGLVLGHRRLEWVVDGARGRAPVVVVVVIWEGGRGLHLRVDDHVRRLAAQRHRHAPKSSGVSFERVRRVAGGGGAAFGGKTPRGASALRRFGGCGGGGVTTADGGGGAGVTSSSSTATIQEGYGRLDRGRRRRRAIVLQLLLGGGRGALRPAPARTSSSSFVCLSLTAWVLLVRRVPELLAHAPVGGEPAERLLYRGFRRLGLGCLRSVAACCCARTASGGCSAKRWSVTSRGVCAPAALEGEKLSVRIAADICGSWRGEGGWVGGRLRV